MRRVVIVWIIMILPALAHMTDRPDLTHWFDGLRNNNKGYCCSEADARETEYEVRGSTYWVPVVGTWREVPDWAVLEGPNKYGRSLLWLDGENNIRCFIPGSGM